MLLIQPIFLPLNPEIEKYKYFSIPNEEINCVSTFEERVDLKTTYYLYNNSVNSKIDFIKKQLEYLLKTNDTDLKIGTEVYNNSYFIFEELYPSILEHLSIEDIYTSNYGTLIIDWEKENNDVFSLEIGSEYLGYFIEVNGNDEKQVDKIKIKESVKDILIDLSNFLVD